jgi:hypothetical protein
MKEVALELEAMGRNHVRDSTIRCAVKRQDDRNMSEIAHEVERMAQVIAHNLHTIELVPEWITEVIYAVHTAEGLERTPHDTTSEFIDEAARLIADSSADTFYELLDEECNIKADFCISDLLRWAQDNPKRLYEKLDSCAMSIVQSLSIAQEEHKREIFDILLNELRARAKKVIEKRFECSERELVEKPIADTVNDADLTILRATPRRDLDEGRREGMIQCRW